MSLKVKKKDVEERFTCPLCTKLFDHATTIPECLHTFCRKCIDDKFRKERLKACPVCNVHLGVIPLRSDYRLENMRLKLFPPTKESVKAGPETVAASLKSSKKKKQSVTSLLASSSRVSFSSDAPVEPNVVVEEKQSEKVEALPHIQSSDKPIITFKKRERKALILEKNDSSHSEQPHKETEVKKFQFDLNIEPETGLDEAEALTTQECIPKEKDHEATPVSYDLCKSLSDGKEGAPVNINVTPVIVEPAITSNGIPISGSDTEESVEPIHNNCVVNRETEEVPVQVNQNAILISSDRDTEEVYSQKLKNKGKGKQECATSRSRKKKGKKPVEKSYSLRPRKDGRAINTEASAPEVAISVASTPEVAISVASTPEVAISVVPEKKVEGRNNAVWFSLVASTTVNKAWRLPQISARCLRVKDRNMTASYLKKYLLVKLGLQSEGQVEIWLRHEPVCSSQTLGNLEDWWFQTTPLPERQSAMVGSSAADFLMVLHYSFNSEFSGSG